MNEALRKEHGKELKTLQNTEKETGSVLDNHSRVVSDFEKALDSNIDKLDGVRGKWHDGFSDTLSTDASIDESNFENANLGMDKAFTEHEIKSLEATKKRLESESNNLNKLYAKYQSSLNDTIRN